jgi:hypothetical protein
MLFLQLSCLVGLVVFSVFHLVVAARPPYNIAAVFALYMLSWKSCFCVHVLLPCPCLV